jgi:uncharacterized protein (DUF885 family)
MSVYDIHSLGIDNVKSIRGEMYIIVNQLEYNVNPNQFIQYLQTDIIFMQKQRMNWYNKRHM